MGLKQGPVVSYLAHTPECVPPVVFRRWHGLGGASASSEHLKVLEIFCQLSGMLREYVTGAVVKSSF